MSDKTASETPDIHVDPSTGNEWVALSEYEVVKIERDELYDEMRKIAVHVGRTQDGSGEDEDWFEISDDVKEIKDALHAAEQRAEADSKRLDWLDSHPDADVRIAGYGSPRYHGKSLREVIDQALTQEGGKP